MPKKTFPKKIAAGKKIWIFKYKKRRFQILLDKILIFRLFNKLHGRFWGVVAVLGLNAGFMICFIIRPELLTPSTALSDFDKDVRTAPYFAGACFFAAYGLWRWRNYLVRTIKRTRPITMLITLTIIGLYLIALMPSSWKPWPYMIHLFGVALMSLSIALTVVFDILLSKTKKDQKKTNHIRLIKLVSFFLIIIGAWLTFASLGFIGLYNVTLLGETTMLLGYTIWIVLKTYQGEESRSQLSRILNKLVIVD